LVGLVACFTSVIAPDTNEPAGMTTWPASSCTSATTVAVNGSPGFAVRELMVSVVAMENCLPAWSVRAAGRDGLLFDASAACPFGLQVARIPMLRAATRVFRYV
jgi:hypothetical protein